MAKSNVHTTHSNKDDTWRNISEGASKPSKVFETKYEAEAAGRQIAINNGVEHIIHNEDGKIAERNSYGNDPFPPRG